MEALTPPAQAPAVLMQLLSLVAQTRDLATGICGLIPALPLPVRRRQHPGRPDADAAGGDTGLISSSTTGASTTGVRPSVALKGAKDPKMSVGGAKC